MRKETLRVSNLIKSRYAREAPGRDTGSGRRYPSPEGPPGPYGINLQHALSSKIDSISQPSRGPVASAETCVKSHRRWNFTVCSAETVTQTAIEAHMTGNAMEKGGNFTFTSAVKRYRKSWLTFFFLQSTAPVRLAEKCPDAREFRFFRPA